MIGEHTYLIKYAVYFGKDAHRTGTIKVKNCASEFHAKVKLEKHFSRGVKHKNETKNKEQCQ